MIMRRLLRLGLIGGLAVAGLRAEMPVAPLGASPVGAVIAAATPTEADDPASGNRALLLENGYDALLVRVHLIRQARRSIEIQTFIWSNDEVGRLLIYELIEAARRGVNVRIIADHMVSDQDPATVAFLATVHPNFQVRHYRPAMARIKPSWWQTVLAAARSFRGINQRMHNKVMLVDDAVLITGGRNIENTYFDHSTGMNFRDRDVLATGPVVQSAVASFESYWNYQHVVPGDQLKDVVAAIRRGDYPLYATRADYDFGGHFDGLDAEANDDALIRAKFAARLQPVDRVRFVADAPGKSAGWRGEADGAAAELRAMAAQARTDIVMQTPYLIISDPAKRLVRELRQQNPALRIRISSNSFASTDNIMAYSANYRLRGTYVDDLQLEVHEFKPRPAALRTLFPRFDEMKARAEEAEPAGPGPFLCLHAKSLVVDDRLSFVGSYNLDPRSENLNTEVGLIVEDEAFARALRAEIEADMRPENSWVIARRELPLGTGVVNGLLEGLFGLSPVDVWPVRNTSSFALRPDGVEVSPYDPTFHRNYREVGSFPGADSRLSTKEIVTRIYKAVGTVFTPVL